MPDAEYVAESVDYLVQRDGSDWCVLEARAVRGRYGSRSEGCEGRGSRGAAKPSKPGSMHGSWSI